MWKVSLDDRAHKELKKLDKQIGQKILDYMQERIATSQNPRRFGKPLSYDKHGLWRYRVGDYRIICRILDDELLVIALRIGHRKDIYN